MPFSREMTAKKVLIIQVFQSSVISSKRWIYSSWNFYCFPNATLETVQYSEAVYMYDLCCSNRDTEYASITINS